MAQTQAKHDASQLFISHADQPVAGQEHVEHEQTIFDLDEEGGEVEEDSEDVEGPGDAAAVPSSSSTTPHSGGAGVQARAGPLPHQANRLWHWADCLSELDCVTRAMDIIHACPPHKHCTSSCLSSLCIILP